MATEKHWDAMYEKPGQEIPWEIEQSPAELVELIESGTVKPGKALDIGCGTGNYSLYLAKRGFAVTGADFSENALALARTKAASAGLAVRFVRADALQLASALKGEVFDFVLEYSLLHHIPDSAVAAYARQVAQLLAPGGKLLVVCYSEKDPDAKGQRVTVGKFGNAMHYRTVGEIRKAYAGLKELRYAETRLGKRLHHAGHCFLFEKNQ